MAQEHDIVFTPHTWTNGMGRDGQRAPGRRTRARTRSSNSPTIRRNGISGARDYIMAEPFLADGAGWLNLSNTPGMGYTVDERRLAQTRIG